MPSPTCLVNGGSTLNGVDVGTGATATIALADVAGVTTWSLTCVGTDETTTTTAINALLSVDQVTKTATLTPVPAAGTAMRFESKVNNGYDVNGVAQASYTTTFALFVRTGGLRVAAVNETTEGDSTYGYTSKFNAVIRSTASTLNSTDAKASVKCLVTSNISNFNSVSTSQDGYTIVAGDRVGVIFQTTQRENGIYVAGTPSGGNVALTRASDFNESAEIGDGTNFYVEQGTIWAGTTWILKVGAAITIDSTNLTFGLQPGTINSTQVQAGSTSKNPTTGTLRLGYNGSIYTRNVALGGNYRLIASDSADGVAIGDTASVSTTLDCATGGFHAFKVNGAEITRQTATTLQWANGIAAPKFFQADKTTNGGTGETLTIQAQNETGTTSTGGALSLQAGSGTTANGSIELRCGSQVLGKFTSGGAAQFSLDASQSYFVFAANGTSQQLYFQTTGASGVTYFEAPTVAFLDAAVAEAWRTTLNGTGASNITVAAGVTGWTIKQADLTTGSGTGATTTIQSQNETGTTSFGGALALTSGTGTSRHGAARLQIGGTTNVEIAQVVASQTVVALARNANLTSTEMPSNSGDKVVYIGNAATAPTANSVSGVILYSESGILKYRDTSGFVVTV